MAELLQASPRRYEDAIVVPEIIAANCEIMHGLRTLVQNIAGSIGHDKRPSCTTSLLQLNITSTLRYPNVPTTSLS
ncbi:hypothetical protein Tco_0738885 [Tanacetum coccineum]